MTPDEEISLRHLTHFLGKYDKYLIAPQNLDVEHSDFEVKRFPTKFFGSATAHTRLMLSAKFYQAFTEYKYILIYHLDALVFSDQLLEWCETDLDYVGSPWLNCSDSPWVQTSRVGNGGFSLRKIESFLNVINSPAYSVDPAKYWEGFYGSKPKYIQYLNLPKKYLKRLHTFNGAEWEMSKWHLTNGYNEDHFWSDQAVKYYSKFKIADVRTGLRFAFEVVPRLCFELNNRTLPFGCHAWPRYDRNFWDPFLLK